MPIKMPPKEKILEAWAAIGAERIKLLSPLDSAAGEAEMSSSDGTKMYRLAWDANLYRSTDNATVWQGYPGYPILALLMLRGLLPLPRKFAELLAPINWNKLNKAAKGNYKAAVEEAFKILGLDHTTIDQINKLVQETYELLGDLDIKVSRYGRSAKSSER